MALDFDSGAGAVGYVLGTLIQAVNSTNDYLGEGSLVAGGINSVGDTVDDLLAQFLTTNRPLLDGLYAARNGHRSSAGSWKTYLRQLAEAYVIQVVDADVLLSSKDVVSALTEMVRQAVSQSKTVERPTVSVAVTPGTNPGSGATAPVCIASVTDPFGAQLPYAYAETIDITATSDAQSGGTVDSEQWSVKGDAAQTDKLAFDWPLGSGCSTTLTTVDPSLDAQASGNLLTNSDYETFTVTDTPDNWVVLVGAASTDIFRYATPYIGTYALEFRGTLGTPLSSIAQTFNVTTGSNVALKPNTVYAVHVRLKKSAGLAAGSISMDLLDGSNAVVNDDASTPNTITVANGAIATSYGSHSGFFRTPRVLPTTSGVITLKFRLRVSVALTNGESVYADDLAMCEAKECYAGGPFVAVFRGSADVIKADTFAVAVSNNYASKFQKGLQRLFSLGDRRIPWPDVGGAGEALSDSLIAP